MFRRFAYMIEKNFELKEVLIQIKDITKEELNSYAKQGATIIDVRSPQEYREGHVDGAISIPDYQMKREIRNRIPNKNQLIVVYCSTGHRSQRAQRDVREYGIYKCL